VGSTLGNPSALVPCHRGLRAAIGTLTWWRSLARERPLRAYCRARGWVQTRSGETVTTDPRVGSREACGLALPQ
jgi:hypothetical protein